MNSTRVSYLAPLLALWLAVGLPHVAGGQQPGPVFDPATDADELSVTHTLNVGEYRRFGFFSQIRLSTDVFFDPSEAESADVRCFYGLGDLNENQRSKVLRDVADENMYLSSKLGEKYYVVEPVRLDPDGRVLGDGRPVTYAHRFPEIWNIPDDKVGQLEDAIERAGSLVASQKHGFASDSPDSHEALPELGVVTKKPDAFSGLPCERIVNWTGETEAVGHIVSRTSPQDPTR